jgi:hypothetical protein
MGMVSDQLLTLLHIFDKNIFLKSFLFPGLFTSKIAIFKINLKPK